MISLSIPIVFTLVKYASAHLTVRCAPELLEDQPAPRLNAVDHLPSSQRLNLVYEDTNPILKILGILNI